MARKQTAVDDADTSSMETRWQELKPDPNSVTPLYLQLARKLADAIQAGVWSAGEALPSERALSEALGVSRITSRKAIALLVEQGLIKRTQGAGSFITPRLEDPLSQLTGFSEMLRRRGFTPSSQWLSREIVPANRDEVIQLGLSPAAAVARLRRLRLADDVVMAVEHSTFPAALIPDPSAIGDSLYAYLDKRGLSIVRALQHFRAVNATEEIASRMGIETGEALLLITRIGFTADQRAIELTDTYCRNDYYDFVAELRR